jgi:hypothetical protein
LANKTKANTRVESVRYNNINVGFYKAKIAIKPIRLYYENEKVVLNIINEDNLIDYNKTKH